MAAARARARCTEVPPAFSQFLRFGIARQDDLGPHEPVHPVRSRFPRQDLGSAFHNVRRPCRGQCKRGGHGDRGAAAGNIGHQQRNAEPRFLDGQALQGSQLVCGARTEKPAYTALQHFCAQRGIFAIAAGFRNGQQDKLPGLLRH